MNTIPRCRICNERLTDNERDWEPGPGQGSYFDAHYSCTSQSADGRYQVRSWDDNSQSWRVIARFAYLVRANEFAADLARCNTARSTFEMVDSNKGLVLRNYVGKIAAR